jgi:hypothetical protein
MDSQQSESVDNDVARTAKKNPVVTQDLRCLLASLVEFANANVQCQARHPFVAEPEVLTTMMQLSQPTLIATPDCKKNISIAGCESPNWRSRQCQRSSQDTSKYRIPQHRRLHDCARTAKAW